MNFSILLVLKDRVHYTIRLMNKWNDENFPYKIWIADGGRDGRRRINTIKQGKF